MNEGETKFTCPNCGSDEGRFCDFGPVSCVKCIAEHKAANRTAKVDTSTKAGKAKHAKGKPRMDLLAYDVLEAMAIVLTVGADKHGARDWEKGIEWSEYFAAAQRHLTDWKLKRGADPETAQSHLDHAMCSLMFLSAYEKRNIGKDDR